ncbi:MAG: hypothetical protein Q9222_003781 [Ikaeria aurantiellina]
MLVIFTFASRLGFILSWNLDCVRIVPQHADVFESVRAGSIEAVRHLVVSGQASARDVTINGISLLHAAASIGHTVLVRFLIEAGADVNAPDEDGETPLHRAVSRKHNFPVTRLLIENGADLANAATGNRTPLLAIFTDTMGQVLKYGEWFHDFVCPDMDGMSVSHYLAWSSQTTPRIFDRGRAHDRVDLWSTDSRGRNCLHLVASRGNIELLTYLLDKASPLDIHKRDSQGCAPIHYAVKTSRTTAVLRTLLGKGADLHAKDYNDRNILHYVAEHSSLEITQGLMALDPERHLVLRDSSGLMPHQHARQNPDSSIYQYLQALISTIEVTGCASTQEASNMTLKEHPIQLIRQVVYKMQSIAATVIPVNSRLAITHLLWIMVHLALMKVFDALDNIESSTSIKIV